MTRVIRPAAGMILCVRTEDIFGKLIRFGEALLGEDNLENHIAVLDHQDRHGTWWAVEGRPGGVGWADATPYLQHVYTLSNEEQVLADAQRQEVCKTMQGLLGTPYDWRAIGEDAVRDLHLDDLWGEKWKGSVAPGHVVCSSVAAYAYHKLGLEYPDNVDLAHVQPSDWADFIIRNLYA